MKIIDKLNKINIFSKLNKINIFNKLKNKNFKNEKLNKKVEFDFKKPFYKLKLDLSFYSLLLVNLAVMIIALIRNLDFTTLFIVFWAQSVIIGLFHFIRIFNLKNFSMGKFHLNKREINPTREIRYTTAILFLALYGFIHFVYLLIFIGKLNFLAYFKVAIIVGMGLFFVNHLFSFIKNFKEDTRREQRIERVMFYPYVRIFPMNLIVVLGLVIFGTKASFIFLILKMIADLVMHDQEHRFKEEPKKRLPVMPRTSVMPEYPYRKRAEGENRTPFSRTTTRRHNR